MQWVDPGGFTYCKAQVCGITQTRQATGTGIINGNPFSWAVGAKAGEQACALTEIVSLRLVGLLSNQESREELPLSNISVDSGVQAALIQ